jgi:ATP-dependent DNA helicase RecG
MAAFRAGTIHVLVSTTVIEVGIDNPNASIIIIQNAERFGLSQLHQMRGRVGRGKKESYCFLFGEPATDTGKRRLRLLTKTNDGFKIAEEDLYLRGPGDFLGTRQSGLPIFAIADIVRDAAILHVARHEAFVRASLVP